MPDAKVIALPLRDSLPQPLACTACGSLWFLGVISLNSDGRVIAHQAGLACNHCGHTVTA